MEAPVYTNNKRDTFRLTRKQKRADDYKYYKEMIDYYDTLSLQNDSMYGDVSEYKRMKVNCDLYNNIIDIQDFYYVCSPFGLDAGELPAQMVNRDISSPRIKALEGMEMKRPFNWKWYATNKEATTRKEELSSSMIQEYVIEQIMQPIRQRIEEQYQAQAKGRDLTPKEKEELAKQMQTEIIAQTPDEVKRYMERDHQDPSEMLAHQITEYLIQQQDVQRKFNKGWKYACLTAYDLFFVGILNDKPILKVVNPIRFKGDSSPDIDFIEDGSWAVAEYRMSPSDVVKSFKLTNKEIDSIYADYEHYVTKSTEDTFFEDKKYGGERDGGTIRVIHCQFIGLRRIGWLDYIDTDGQLQTKMLVDEDYVLNKENGDVRIVWEYIPIVEEGWKIGSDIYKNMQELEGQIKDINNLYETKLSYHGARIDDMNSQPTAPMDRTKYYQYYFNIVLYRAELLMASDKGKKILMNIGAIPDSAGINVKQWQYYFESSPFMYFNPEEEGMENQDVNTIAKVLDLSLASDIQKYIDLAMFLEQQCGKALGVTDPVLGQTSASDTVGNNQQNLIQTSHILEPYFALHNTVKRNVLTSLFNVAKIAYRRSGLETLSYVLDDMSIKTLNVDISLLDGATLGLFVENSGEAKEVRDAIMTLVHAAVQNQKIELSDVVSVIKESASQGAEEILKTAEKTRRENEQQSANQDRQFRAEEAEKARQHEKEVWKHEADMIVLKETERRETVIQAQAMLSVGFNEDKDFDKDGELDVMEIARNATEASIRISEENRKARELNHKIEDDKVKNQLTEKSINVQKQQKSK